MKIFLCACTVTLLTCFTLLNNATMAQEVGPNKAESSTAILNTVIPFAIGAREGEQTIRGSFGWPTFQEGFVEGVYFRFDPDGYARFSTSPRLDEDVFEVICQNATTICSAKKNGLEIELTDQGKPQLRISGTTPTDTFFISDRKNELPLPNTILGPLDQNLETLLSSGGDLIIRRELETLQTLSLSGFSAAVTYLRWVAQNQASFVFPRGWPVPSQQARQENTNLTTPGSRVLSNSGRQSTTALWPSQNLQTGLGQTPAQNNQVLAQGGLQVGNRYSTLRTVNNYEQSGIGFAQQAQGRNLPADTNRFEAPPGLENSYQNVGDRAVSNTVDLQEAIRFELSVINQSIRNLDVKIENLATRLTYELRVNNGVDTRQQETIISTDRRADGIITSLLKSNEPLSEDEARRNLIIDRLLQQSQDGQMLNPPNAETLGEGEISVKKNIVERLLEELNTTQVPEEKPANPAVESADEFISLSDYINKIMQAEKRN